jgi:tellurite resistance protein TehA-like permease
MNVAYVTIGFGAILSLLGVFGYFHAEPELRSLTALIPLAFGLGLIACGAVVLSKPSLRMHVMHVAVLLGLVGFLAAAGRWLSKLPVVLTDDKTVDKFPVRMVGAMAIVCLVYTCVCVASFVSARRRRKVGEGAA